MRFTKIVATLGPATDSVDILAGLFDAGVNVFRLNASHAGHEDHARRIQAVRDMSRERKQHVGILLDLQGPKIRLGGFVNGGCLLEKGSIFTLTTQPVEGTPEIASTSYPEFARDVKPGNRVLLADGALRLEVLSTDGIAAKCRVIHGGWISNRKGINLPGVHVSTPSLSKKDVADAHFGVDQAVDFMALSFVRMGKDVLRLRHLLEEADSQIPIIAKIEKPEGWQNLDAIMEEADGIMVARGDLGVEMDLERVPMIQKAIIERCQQKGRFVITATQMLESMVESPVPTRAEVSDIANAIYDGTGATMLSAETSAGKHPVAAATMMDRIARRTDADVRKRRSTKEIHPGLSSPTAQVIADAACHIAQTADVVAMAVCTASGATAKLISTYRPSVPVFAFTASEVVARQLSIIYGVEAIMAPPCTTTDSMLIEMERILVSTGRVKAGDNVLLVAGQPVNTTGSTNLIHLRCAAPSD